MSLADRLEPAFRALIAIVAVWLIYQLGNAVGGALYGPPAWPAAQPSRFEGEDAGVSRRPRPEIPPVSEAGGPVPAFAGSWLSATTVTGNGKD